MAHLIHIGNSLGVRIPKVIIAQLGFRPDTSLEFKVMGQSLLISPTQQVRAGWDKAFEEDLEMVNPLLMGDALTNKFDLEEWEW